MMQEKNLDTKYNDIFMKESHFKLKIMFKLNYKINMFKVAYRSKNKIRGRKYIGYF